MNTLPLRIIVSLVLGLGVSVATSAAPAPIRIPVDPGSQIAGAWQLGMDTVGYKEIQRYARTQNRHGATFTLSHLLNSDVLYATLTLPKSRFPAFDPGHGLLLRVDGGEVLRADQYSPLLAKLRFDNYSVDIMFFFKDRFLVNPNASQMAIRWVDRSGREHVSEFSLEGYPEALNYVARPFRDMSRMLDSAY